MQNLMFFVVSLNIFCLRKIADFEKVTFAVFEAVLFNEFLKQCLGHVVVNHGVPGHLELIEVSRIGYYISLHTLVIDEVNLYLMV